MAYRLAYEYNSEEINSPRIDVFLVGENIFNVGGFTLKPNLQYTNRRELSLGLKAIEGKPGFFASSNLAEGIISCISPLGVESKQRAERNGYWIQLASYVLEEEPVDNITVNTEILDGDFFLASGENIAVLGSTFSIKTQLGNVQGLVQIQGDYLEGRALQALAELSDPEGIGVLEYTWLRSINGQTDWEVKEGAINSAYTPTQDDVGYYFKVIVSYVDGFGNKELLSSSVSSSNIQNVDSAATAQVIISGNAEEGSAITAVLENFSDPDGSLASKSFKWQRFIPSTTPVASGGPAIDLGELNIHAEENWVDLDGQTSADLQIPDDQSLVGSTLRAVINTTDSLGGSSTFYSDPLTVQNVDDAPTGSVTINGEFTQHQTLTAANTLSDQDGIGAISYSWLRNGDAIATGSSYTLSQGDVGQSIALKASYTDAYGQDTSVTSNPSPLIQNVDDSATAQVVINGNAEEGGSLTAVLESFSDPDGSLASSTTQWQQQLNNQWVDLDGQTSADLQIPDDQSLVGSTLRAVINTTDSLGGSSTFYSGPLTVQNVDDAPTGSVTINGEFTQYQTLTADNTLSDQDGIGTISYSWLRNGAAIATGSSYTLTQVDVGTSIVLKASYTDAYGQDTSFTSNPSPRIQNIDDPASGDVVIDGSAAEGSSLTAYLFN
jgi:hypothetical protein